MISILSTLRSEKDDLLRIELAFKLIDLNNDGVLSFDEIQKADKKFASFGLGRKWNEILRKIDTNNDGVI